MRRRLARAAVVGAMALGSVVAVTSFGTRGDAQADATSAVRNPGVDTAPAVSDDGRLIVFVSTPVGVGSVPSLRLHDRGPTGPAGTRLPATTSPIPGSEGARNPQISGDGCIITWSVDERAIDDAEMQPAPVPSAPVNDEPVADEPVGSSPMQAALRRIVVLDRCADPLVGLAGPRVDIPVADGDGPLGAAVPSVDGSVVVVSNGDDVIRFLRRDEPAVEWIETGRFDGSDTGDHAVAARVDVSDDGAVVVYAAGPDLADLAQTTVYATALDHGGGAATAPVLVGATDPTVSGDGMIVAASTGSNDATQARLTLVDRARVPLTPIDLGPGGRPAISGDGNHVAHENDGHVGVVSRTGQGTAAFATTRRTVLSATTTPTSSGAVIDRFGRTVVNDLATAEQAPQAETDLAVTVIAADASFDAAVFDLGTGGVSAVLAATITFSNRGPASVGVADLAVDGAFTITDERCGTVVRPGTTCEVDLSFTVERTNDTTGVVTLTPASFGVAPFTAEVIVQRVAPPTSPPSTTPGSTGGTSTGGSSGGASTGGSTRGTTTGRTSTGGSTRGTTTGRSSTGSSTRGTTTGGRTTSTTVAPGARVSASPSSFEFAPTIVDAGRRTGLVEIVNNGSDAVRVIAVRLEPAEGGPFQIVQSACADAFVDVGQRCAVTLEFAPIATGSQGASLIATLDDGTDVTAAVTGTGAPAPTVAVVPEVATVGQVVTLRGAGFPTDVTVDVTWASTVMNVLVDESGTFDVPVVVMPNTRSGPVEVTVAGQTDLFGDVTGSMLVTSTSDRSGPGILDGIGPNIGR